MECMPQPTLTTKRLNLRPFQLQDASEVQHLAGDYQIASVTSEIPHPYLDGMAQPWIESQKRDWEKGTLCCYAVELRETHALVGCVSLMDIQDGKAELGYWIGVDFWGQGICTEACTLLLNFGVSRLELSEIVARHLTRNPASGNVIKKLGFKHSKQASELWPRTGETELVEYYSFSIKPSAGVDGKNQLSAGQSETFWV